MEWLRKTDLKEQHDIMEKISEMEKRKKDISGITMAHYLKERERKKKGSYVNGLFKENNLKPVKETFYINGQKFTTIKLVEKENGKI